MYGKSSNSTKYSKLNNEHNWEDLGIHLRNQQTCNHNYIQGSVMLHSTIDDDWYIYLEFMMCIFKYALL